MKNSSHSINKILLQPCPMCPVYRAPLYDFMSLRLHKHVLSMLACVKLLFILAFEHSGYNVINILPTSDNLMLQSKCITHQKIIKGLEWWGWFSHKTLWNNLFQCRDILMIRKDSLDIGNPFENMKHDSITISCCNIHWRGQILLRHFKDYDCCVYCNVMYWGHSSTCVM